MRDLRLDPLVSRPFRAHKAPRTCLSLWVHELSLKGAQVHLHQVQQAQDLHHRAAEREVQEDRGDSEPLEEIEGIGQIAWAD